MSVRGLWFCVAVVLHTGTGNAVSERYSVLHWHVRYRDFPFVLCPVILNSLRSDCCDIVPSNTLVHLYHCCLGVLMHLAYADMDIHPQCIAKCESDQLLHKLLFQTRKCILSLVHYLSVILGIVNGWFMGWYLFFICWVLCLSNQSLTCETVTHQLRHSAKSYSDLQIVTCRAPRGQAWNAGLRLTLYKDHCERCSLHQHRGCRFHKHPLSQGFHKPFNQLNRCSGKTLLPGCRIFYDGRFLRLVFNWAMYHDHLEFTL